MTIFDLSSRFISRKHQKDELASRDYRLKLNDLEKIGKLQDMADDLNVGRLELVESTNSNLPELRKETKIEAVESARAKAQYMLEAIGDKIGRAVLVQELPDDPQNLPTNGRYPPNFSVNQRVNSRDAVAPSLPFTQIKLRYEILATFEIE